MTKYKASIVAIVIALAFIIAGTLALFTGKTDSGFKAIAGTVNVDIDDIDLTNPDKISPGDGDIDSETNEENEHVLSYTVSNNGNKSVRTRQTIVLSAKNKDKVLDANMIKLIAGSKELDGKTALNENGDETSGEAYAIKYEVDGDIFDGKGEDIESGGEAEKEDIQGTITENNDGDVSETYKYVLALDKNAGNDFQDADFNIEVIVEAMQYRNTDENDWDDVKVVKKTYSTHNFEGNFVPDSDEELEGGASDD